MRARIYIYMYVLALAPTLLVLPLVVSFPYLYMCVHIITWRIYTRMTVFHEQPQKCFLSYIFIYCDSLWLSAITFSATDRRRKTTHTIIIIYCGLDDSLTQHKIHHRSCQQLMYALNNIPLFLPHKHTVSVSNHNSRNSFVHLSVGQSI